MCAITEGDIGAMGAMGVLVGLVGWRFAVVRWVVVPCIVGGPSRLVNVLAGLEWSGPVGDVEVVQSVVQSGWFSR